jgi:hypothetical protein
VVEAELDHLTISKPVPFDLHWRTQNALEEELSDLIERRRAAREHKTAEGQTVLAMHVVHRAGRPVGDFRDASTGTASEGRPGDLL